MLLCGTISSLLATALIWWKNPFQWLYSKYKHARAVSRYKRDLIAEISSLIVIGRRTGFDLAKVYVKLDLGRSDLMAAAAAPERFSLPRNYVVVGGPGAGKSTYVKKLLLQESGNNPSHLSFFLRLREYDQPSP